MTDPTTPTRREWAQDRHVYPAPPTADTYCGICYRPIGKTLKYAAFDAVWVHEDCAAEYGVEYAAYTEAQLARGDLAFAPDTMPCYICAVGSGANAVDRKVTALGHVVGAADPTQTYVLDCGHVAI